MSQFFVASIKHTGRGHEHVVWWGRFQRGYTPVLGEYAGRYCYGEAAELNDGHDCLAVPVSVVESLWLPEPYYAPGKRFYDQRGPVVRNDRPSWDVLIAGRLAPERHQYRSCATPEVFRGRRRAIFVK